jgi:hypothetical protein
VFGVYDGDMRERIENNGYRWKYGFLPGQVSPEELLIELAQNTPELADALAVELARPVDQITMALNHVQGSDHHDYFHQFAEFLNIEAFVAQRGFVRVWLGRGGNIATAESLLEQVREASRDWS